MIKDQCKNDCDFIQIDMLCPITKFYLEDE